MPLSRSSLSRIASKLAFTCTAVGVRLKRAGWRRQTTRTAPATTVRRQHAQTNTDPAAERAHGVGLQAASRAQPPAAAAPSSWVVRPRPSRGRGRAARRRASGAALAPCPARASARARHARSQPNPAPGAGRGTRISSRDHDALAGLELLELHACCLLDGLECRHLLLFMTARTYVKAVRGGGSEERDVCYGMLRAASCVETLLCWALSWKPWVAG